MFLSEEIRKKISEEKKINKYKEKAKEKGFNYFLFVKDKINNEFYPVFLYDIYDVYYEQIKYKNWGHKTDELIRTFKII